ncbi:MAG: hypothetical protein WC651_01910 [Candidatus Gracilibacteria bacterium]
MERNEIQLTEIDKPTNPTFAVPPRAQGGGRYRATVTLGQMDQAGLNDQEKRMQLLTGGAAAGMDEELDHHAPDALIDGLPDGAPAISVEELEILIIKAGAQRLIEKNLQ